MPAGRADCASPPAARRMAAGGALVRRGDPRLSGVLRAWVQVFGLRDRAAGPGTKTVSPMLEQFAGENNNKTVTVFLRFSKEQESLPRFYRRGKGCGGFRANLTKIWKERARLPSSPHPGKKRPPQGAVPGRRTRRGTQMTGRTRVRQTQEGSPAPFGS